MQQNDLAQFIESEITGLLTRLPALAQLRFAEGTPFADAATQAWLDTILRSAPNASTAQTSTDNNKLDYYLTAAKKQVRKKNLSDLLDCIANMPANNAKDEFQKQRAMAKLCVENKRPDLAISLLEKLALQMEQYHLITWEPELVLSLWVEIYTLLNNQLKQATGEPVKTAITAKMETLRKSICQINPAKAASLF